MSKHITAALLAATAIASLAACSSQEQDQAANKMGSPVGQGPTVSVKEALRLKFANCIKATVAPYNGETATIKHNSGPDRSSTLIALPPVETEGPTKTDIAVLLVNTDKGLRVTAFNRLFTGPGLLDESKPLDAGVVWESILYSHGEKNTVMATYDLENDDSYIQKHRKTWADFGKAGMLSNPAVQSGIQKCATKTFGVNFIMRKG